MQQAAQRIITPSPSAETPALFIHPRSASATGRARFNTEAAYRLIGAARKHRLAGRTDFARSALALAGIARRQAAAELNAARGS